MRVNMKDKELFKMFIPTLNMRWTLLLFSNMVINGLKCIGADIGPDNCCIYFNHFDA